jgi:hypothetical protein
MKVQELLKNGANAHLKDPETGRSPLQFARRNKQRRIEALLRQHIEAKPI